MNHETGKSIHLKTFLSSFCFIEDECNKTGEVDKENILNSPVKDRKRTGSTTEMAVDQLQASEKLIKELNETWEQKLKRTEEIRQREFSLRSFHCFSVLYD